MTARRVLALLLGALFIAAAVVVALNVRDEGEGLDSPVADSIATRTPADLIARGEYLARAGDCIACHTARGGVPYAGGRGIETPFGTVYAPNLTPDPQTGLGQLVGQRLLARAAQRPLARRPAALSGVPVPELHPRRAGRLGCDVRLPAQPAAGRASQPAAHARLSVQPAGVARDLARALLQARCLHARSGAAGRMEPRRLSGRRARPLQRLPFEPQCARRTGRPARSRRRPDPGAELVRAVADRRSTSRAWPTGKRTTSSRC